MFLTPGWVVVHLLVWAAAVGMVFLGRWQLHVSDAKHFDLQNFGYAFQWWAFSIFAVVFWLRMLRDRIRGAAAQLPSTGGELAVRGGGGLAQVGPADLVARTGADGGIAVPYRGYLMPQSDTSPARSEGDRFHAAYNDYLWRLSLNDPGSQAEVPQPRPTGQPGRAGASGRPAQPPAAPRIIDAVPALDAPPVAEERT